MTISSPVFVIFAHLILFSQMTILREKIVDFAKILLFRCIFQRMLLKMTSTTLQLSSLLSLIPMLKGQRAEYLKTTISIPNLMKN